MVKKIRLLLEYNTYPIWLYDEDDEIVDNDNPPEWDDDQQLTDAFMEASDLYDTFFIPNGRRRRSPCSTLSCAPLTTAATPS